MTPPAALRRRQPDGPRPATVTTHAPGTHPARAAHRDARVAAIPAERIAAKRVYEPPVAADGTRVLIMRYWPRGIRKEKVDVWLRELAPVIPLLRAYLDGKITWEQYVPRYREGLTRPEAQAALAEARALAAKGPITLLCGCADPARCHRSLLRAHLLDSARG